MREDESHSEDGASAGDVTLLPCVVQDQSSQDIASIPEIVHRLEKIESVIGEGTIGEMEDIPHEHLERKLKSFADHMEKRFQTQIDKIITIVLKHSDQNVEKFSKHIQGLIQHNSWLEQEVRDLKEEISKRELCDELNNTIQKNGNNQQDEINEEENEANTETMKKIASIIESKIGEMQVLIESMMQKDKEKALGFEKKQLQIEKMVLDLRGQIEEILEDVAVLNERINAEKDAIIALAQQSSTLTATIYEEVDQNSKFKSQVKKSLETHNENILESANSQNKLLDNMDLIKTVVNKIEQNCESQLFNLSERIVEVEKVLDLTSSEMNNFRKELDEKKDKPAENNKDERISQLELKLEELKKMVSNASTKSDIVDTLLESELRKIKVKRKIVLKRIKRGQYKVGDNIVEFEVQDGSIYASYNHSKFPLSVFIKLIEDSGEENSTEKDDIAQDINPRGPNEDSDPIPHYMKDTSNSQIRKSFSPPASKDKNYSPSESQWNSPRNRGIEKATSSNTSI